jgi:predicted O-methyltransferase YrrM
MRNSQSSRISSLLAIPLLGRLRSGLKLLLGSQPSRRGGATATASTLRPLLPIDAANRFAAKTPIDVEWLRGLINSETYKTLVLPYFYLYPPRSLMDPNELALLYCLIRTLKPENVVEIGTYYAGTTEVLARAVWENGVGCVHSIDPYGAGRVSDAIAVWPPPLRAITTCSFDNSMSFLTQLRRSGTPIDFVLIDGEHDFEFVRFDLEMCARLLRPGGIIVIDDAEQAGPFSAAKSFLADHPQWRELGDCVAAFRPSNPFDDQRSSVPRTSLLLLQAPPYFAVEGDRFRSWGQQDISTERIVGFEVDLAAATGAGILHVQTILRTFGAGQTWIEIKSSVTQHIAFADQPRTIRQDLPRPLVAVSEQGEPIDFCTAEVELFWCPEQANDALKLLAPPRPVVPQESALAELPPLLSPQVWDGITGLAAIPLDTPRIVTDFQVLQLVAVAPEGVHSLSMRSSGHVAGSVYRATVWVGAPWNANVRLMARDSEDPRTGNPTNEIDVKVDLHSLAVIEPHGKVLGYGVEEQAGGWRRIWVDLKLSDENIAVALFFLESGSNFHVFKPRGQRLLLGGFDIARLDMAVQPT